MSHVCDRKDKHTSHYHGYGRLCAGNVEVCPNCKKVLKHRTDHWNGQGLYGWWLCDKV